MGSPGPVSPSNTFLAWCCRSSDEEENFPSHPVRLLLEVHLLHTMGQSAGGDVDVAGRDTVLFSLIVFFSSQSNQDVSGTLNSE